jgi:hypothetical protein
MILKTSLLVAVCTFLFLILCVYVLFLYFFLMRIVTNFFIFLIFSKNQFYLFIYLFLKQGFKTLPRLALNSQSSCLSFLSAGIISMHHHVQLKEPALCFIYKTGNF